mmetsp:Transcript_36017/g.88742  ORF Transcript_36017/g.88742 Transcript_36017/m.88742 type:complete len:222 (-) Transcript_36017:1131-1796(-)
MRSWAWGMPALRSDTHARSFHLDAHTCVSALHARSQHASSSGGSMPAAVMAAPICASIPSGAITLRTHSRHARSDASSASSDESSTASSSCARSSATISFTGSFRMCSKVPKGTTMERGSLIHSGILPPPRLSFRLRVLRALAPTTPSLNSSSGTVNLPQNSICASWMPCGIPLPPSAPPAPALVTEAASTSSHVMLSPTPIFKLTALPSSAPRPFRICSS